MDPSGRVYGVLRATVAKKKKKEKERAALLNRKGTNRRQEGPFGAAMDSLEYYDEMETRSTPLP